MLNIEIDNPEIENNLKEIFGDNSATIAKAFIEFIQQQKNKQDIGISIKELDDGKGIDLADVIEEIASKYE